MKIRTSFISNSSSMNFIIYKKCTTKEIAESELEAIERKINSMLNNDRFSYDAYMIVEDECATAVASFILDAQYVEDAERLLKSGGFQFESNY